MVDIWWCLLGAAIPAVMTGQVIRVKSRWAEEERLKSAAGGEKSLDEAFVCRRVCTLKRMLKKVGVFSKDPSPVLALLFVVCLSLMLALRLVPGLFV